MDFACWKDIGLIKQLLFIGCLPTNKQIWLFLFYRMEGIQREKFYLKRKLMCP